VPRRQRTRTGIGSSLGELASVSEAAGQLQFRVRALEDQRMVDRCEMLEEKDGRINSEALNHVVIKGKNVPFIDQSDDLQQKLKAQVLFLYISMTNIYCLFMPLGPYINLEVLDLKGSLRWYKRNTILS